MCGIAGFWQQGGAALPLEDTVRRMTYAIRHRGPDGHGHWVDADAGVALGHRRLSILDLSSAGAQPMVSPAGRYVITFNGEIYNWKELRAEEERYGAKWRGHSDTEVILALADRLGPESMLEQSEGMFALALWDRADGRLLLARDRFGEKPLYWGWMGNTLAFASELRALRMLPGWRKEVDPDALTLLFRHGYIPAPYSIIRGIRKLDPATAVWFEAGRPRQEPTPRPFWSLAAVARAGLADPFPDDEATVLSALDAELAAAVGQQMVADVPLGAFLSGGVDSSLVVALMQRQSARPIRTFTIGFEDREYDESADARAVARHLRTDHMDLVVAPHDALAVIPELPSVYDEPFADSSQIPTVLVSRLARQSVTVSLSGDGGDELFAGYSRYGVALGIERRVGWVPPPIRVGMAAAIDAVPRRVWDLMGRIIPAPEGFRGRINADRMRRFSQILSARGRADRYRALVSHLDATPTMLLHPGQPRTALDVSSSFANALDEMTYCDLVMYLPGDILAKVDRAAMSVSLESRAPFLHPRVAALGWRVPRGLKWRGGRGKWILRSLLDRYVPRALTERPKKGFGVPVDRWLRGPLRDWAETLLSERALAESGLLKVDAIRAMWAQHNHCQRNWQYELWNVLMFQAWRLADR